MAAPEAGDTIVDIQTKGNRLVLREEIIEILDSYIGGPYDREKIKNDLLKIYELGYFDKKSLEAKPYKTDEGVILVYQLAENKAITALEIYGNRAIEEVDIYGIFMPLVGKPENVNLIADKIKELESAYAQKGYIVARVNDIDLEADGTLKIYMEEGLLTDIKFTGNEKTKESYLKHVLQETKLGAAYNENDFLKDFKRLQSTGYYSEIRRSLIPNVDGKGYTLNVAVQEKRTISIGAGGGVNTRSGLFGNVTFSAGNLRGKGEKFALNGTAGSGLGSNNTFDSNTRLFRRRRIVNLNARYTVPYFRDSNNTFNYSAELYDGPSFVVDLADQTKTSLGLGLTKPLTDRDLLRGQISANYISLDNRRDNEYRDFLTGAILDRDGININDRFEDNTRDYIRAVRRTRGVSRRRARAIVRSAQREANRRRDNQLDDGLYASFRGSYIFNNLDNAQRPRRGWKNVVRVEPVGSIGDFDSFVKSSASATKYFPLPKDSTFVVHGRVGYDVFDNMPDFSQFRLGGVRGVRGYRPFSELGVGTRLGLASTELRTPLYNIVPQFKKIKFMRGIDLAFFADAGLVGGNSSLNNLSDRLNRALSVGLGVRVKLPLVGAIRVDLGVPLVEALVDDTRFFRVNFNVAERF